MPEIFIKHHITRFYSSFYKNVNLCGLCGFNEQNVCSSYKSNGAGGSNIRSATCIQYATNTFHILTVLTTSSTLLRRLTTQSNPGLPMPWYSGDEMVITVSHTDRKIVGGFQKRREHLFPYPVLSHSSHCGYTWLCTGEIYVALMTWNSFKVERQGSFHRQAAKYSTVGTLLSHIPDGLDCKSWFTNRFSYCAKEPLQTKHHKQIFFISNKIQCSSFMRNQVRCMI